MTHKWNYQPITPEQAETSQKLAQELGISPILGGLLVQRGITKAQDAKKFFRPQLPDLHDPFLMKDMDVAVERLNKAMGKKERILIYGDYDVDGTTAVALVYKFIQQFYSNIDYYIPDRYNEGYGVSTKGVDYAAETGVGLIIVLDCGIKAVEEITYAKEKGIDFIICDPHVPDDVLPPAAAILNAKRLDNTYPYEHLSGCGVGFKFMQAFAISNGIEFHHLIPLLDLVAARLKPTVIDRYLTILVERYGDRRNCTAILPTAPTGTYREPDRDAETGRYRIASGMEAVWVILHEPAWNEGGAWKFIIDDITYTVE